jgi:hypothetical protein
VCMPKKPRDSKPGKEPARLHSAEKLISFHFDMRIIKKGGRIFVAEVTARISEITTTNNNLIQFPVRRAHGTDHRGGG